MTFFNKETASGVAGRKWRFLSVDQAKVDAMTAQGVSDPVARILAGRDVDPATVLEFLDPEINRLMPEMDRFPDMDKATAMMADAIQKGWKIGIWSDYDCDGATSAATLGLFLRMCGHEDFTIRIPDRIKEGYGPNVPGITEMFDQGHDVIFVLDCGTVATGVFDPMPDERRARIVVIDHHLPHGALPQIAAVVNPNREDQLPGYEHLCAAGVTFFACYHAGKTLKARGFAFPEVPRFSSLLDVVALGTVADVVPLVTINRALVKRGLRVMNESPNTGIKALLEAAGMGLKKADARTCGYALGPRINAEGRIGDSGAGAALLLERDPHLAREMALSLNNVNRERQDIERDCTRQAREYLDPREVAYKGNQERRIRIAVVDAHEGVVGISASRIKEAFGSPAIVLTHVEDEEMMERRAHGEDVELRNLIKGSARSVDGFNIGHAINAAAHDGLLVKGGGHGMAGGLTMEVEKLEAFEAFMNAEIAASEYGKYGSFDEFDAIIHPDDLSVHMVNEMLSIAPFGTKNPEPRIVVPHLKLLEVGPIGKKPDARHLKMVFETPQKQKITGVIFGVDIDGQGDLERNLVVGRECAIACKLEVDMYGGGEGKVKLMVSDMYCSPDMAEEIAAHKARKKAEAAENLRLKEIAAAEKKAAAAAERKARAEAKKKEKAEQKAAEEAAKAAAGDEAGF